MTCADCGFEYEEGSICPRCGYDPAADLVGFVEVESPVVTNALEVDFNTFCQEVSSKGLAPEKVQEQIQARWREVDARAKGGDLDARHLVSHICLAHKDLASAHRILAGLSDAGHALAQVDLAHLYEEGAGVEKNLYDAIRLYRQAASKGNPLALYKLAEQHGRDGVLQTDPLLASAIMEKLVVKYPNLFQRKPGCQGGCDKGPSDGAFAVQTAFQMTKLLKYAVILGILVFVAYVVWTEFCQ